MDMEKLVSFPTAASAATFARGVSKLANALMIHLVETRGITLGELDEIHDQVLKEIKGDQIGGVSIDAEAAALRAAIEALEGVLADHRRTAERFG
jgi:predicted transcriptional regulator